MANTVTDTSQNIALNLSDFRQSHGFTQASLARLAKIPRSTITLLESGSANPSIHVLLQIAGVFQVSVEELISKPQPRCQLIKAKDIPLHRRSRDGVKLRKLLPDALGAIEFDELTLAPGTQLIGSPHISGTREYFLGIHGRTSVIVGQACYEVNEGDMLSFDGNQTHTYKNTAKETSMGLSLIVLQS